LLLLEGCGENATLPRQDPAMPDGSSAADVAIEMEDFSVPPGGEVYKCQNFANPFGKAVDIDRFEAHMPAGSHHMIVFFVDDITDGALEDCSGTEFHPNVFGSQTPDGVVDLPHGIGVAVPPTSGLRFQLHVVNTSQKDEVATVATKFHVATPGSIREHAGQFFFSNMSFSIPPSVPTEVTKTCSLTTPISILGVSAHVHKHAVDFVASSGGTTLYKTKDLAEPIPNRFDPPFELPANQDVTFTCSYVNDTNTAITFGESALTDEMCIFAGIYYPVEDVTNPNILCL
jgi:hypothetical protein